MPLGYKLPSNPVPVPIRVLGWRRRWNDAFGTAGWRFYREGELVTAQELWGEEGVMEDAVLTDPLHSLVMAEFAAPFEGRKLQVSWTIDGGTVAGEDVRVCTFHLLKLTAGAPDAAWLAADFTAVRNAVVTWWQAMDDFMPDNMKLSRTAFYKFGPDISPPQPPVNAVDHTTLPGLGTGAALPPQVACTVMERHGDVRKNHGRFYFPAPTSANISDFGRPTGAFITSLANATDAMYEAWRTGGTPAVIYLPALPERSPDAPLPQHRTKGTFAARSASARTVDEIVVDNIFDVIRSRRYDTATDRQARTIGA